MKTNLKVRIKNPWFWVGLLGVIFTAMGVSPDVFTSWEILWEHLLGLLKNPFLLGSVATALLGVFVDPTTAGVGDSAQALTYNEPKKK
jgi:phi LC3 family holin